MNGKFSDLTPLVELTEEGWPLVVMEAFDYTLSVKLYDKLGDIDRRAFAKGIRVPVGLSTDLASIPRALTRVFPPYGKYSAAAIVHDYLYSPYCKYYCTRKGADMVLRDAMRTLGVRESVCQLFYLGVRCGGWIPWSKAKEGRHE